MSKEDIAKAFEQIEEVDAVVSTIGGTPADPMADSQVCCLAASTILVASAQRSEEPHGLSCKLQAQSAQSVRMSASAVKKGSSCV